MQKSAVKTYEHLEACTAQVYYCDSNNVPHFAPKTGFCPHCGHDIYGVGGISVEEAGSTLVTGCPFCHFSFCD